MSSDATLAARVQALEDRAAISELRARFCRLIDESRWADVAALFVEDGFYRGRDKDLRGREQLHAYFASGPRRRERAWHFIHNETVAIDGDRATGSCYLDCPLVVDGTPVVCAASYDDELVRTPDGWRFQGRTIAFFYMAPLAEGWVDGAAADVARAGVARA
jgi:hypothetical protein